MDPVTRARINSQMLAVLADLLVRQVRDPRVDGTTLTAVEVTDDLSYAKVYFSHLGDGEARRVAQRGLETAAGFLRREIGRRLHLRTAPQLRFHFDASLEHGQRIETLLREWHEESNRRQGGPAAGEDEQP
jgi:ribosome-binding factor A